MRSTCGGAGVELRVAKPNPSEGVRRCMFCNGPLGGARSREHYIPMWLLRHQGVADETIDYTALDSSGNVLDVRRMARRSVVAGGVCESCNGGWMNDLEGEMRRILPPLIDGSDTVASLDEDDLLPLARWACKAAYCHDHSTHGPRRVPSRHAKALWRDADRVPQGVVVAAARSPIHAAIGMMESPNWTVVDTVGRSDEVKRRDHDRSYKVGLQAGHLVLVVAFYPNSLYGYGLVKGLHEVVSIDRADGFEVEILDEVEHRTANGFLAHALYALQVSRLGYPGGYESSVTDRVYRY